MSLMMKIARLMVKRNTSGLFDQPEIDVTKVRATLDTMNAKNEKLLKPEEGVEVTFDKLKGVDISLCTPKSWNNGDILYYVHGGGLVTGDHKFAIPYASQLAKLSGYRVASINYRLAPEHPFPAGLDDSFAIYKELSKKHNVALLGESGGAYLSVAVALKCKIENEKLPRSIVVNSIPADFSGKFIPRSNSKGEITLSVEGVAALYRMYYSDVDDSNPLVNVINGDFSKFPPVRVVYDANELLKPDSVALIGKLQESGVPVEHQEYRGTFHAFTTAGKATKESKREMASSVAFIKRNM